MTAATEHLPLTHPAPARIIVVDDDAELRRLIGDFLREQDFEVVTAADAAGLDRYLAGNAVDLILLDVMMPGEDGLSVLGRLRGPNRPGVIMLSAMGDDGNRIEGLDLGADDYLAKPCNPRELLARIRAVLRRRTTASTAVAARNQRFGGWTLDVINRSLTHASAPSAQLTDAEFRVLNALLEAPLAVMSRDQLLDSARGGGSEIFDRAIDVTVSRLRRKLEPERLIETVRNEGYRLVATPVAG